MKTKALIIMLAALAVAAGFAIRATSEIDDANIALAALASQGDELRHKSAALDERLRMVRDAIAEAEKSEATLAKNRGAADSSAAPAGGHASDQPAPAARKLSPASLVANDPKKMAEYAKNYRESLDLTLGGLFKQLGLLPEQIEKVKDLKVWVEQSRMDLEAAAQAQGLDMQGEAYQKMRWGVLENGGKKEAEVFASAELLDRNRRYSRLGYLRNTVQRIASSEMGSDTPATFLQVERAIDIVAANSQRRDPKNPERWSYGWSWPDWATINWEIAGPQLQRELSPGQFALLRQFLRTQETWSAVAKRNAANQTEAAKLTRRPGG
ncbi:MAG: hypothetical protein HY736_08570 [Verrucomicrobia bacterium]|nr:hypothetical protein [Verrucomicrobiota bacterium]